MNKVIEKNLNPRVGVFEVYRFYIQTQQHMKLHKFYFLFLIALAVLMGCQQEAEEVKLPKPEEAFTASSNAAKLFKEVTMRDGSYDNILDSSSCVSLILPVTVIVNGQEFTVSSEDEFKLIERVLDESAEDEDEVNLQYPVTIVLPDHTQRAITNEDELENYTDQCTEDGFDDDIECIDFVYPIKLTVYNTSTQISTVVTIDSDKQLYDFIESLEDEDLVGFKFPVTMVLSDGSELIVNNVEELEIVIENAENDCDEDDDNDFDDDDVDTSTLEAILTDGSWKISYYFDETNQTTLYNNFTFTFNIDGTVVANNGSEDFLGTWTLYGDDGALELELTFENNNDLLDEITEDWIVTSFNTTLLELNDGDENGAILKFQKL
jgi:hypothetical protein